MKLYPVSKIKLNPKNPRIIKDDKFQKLVASLQEFPEMASVRPIVCNTDMVILGGNMRFKAMQAAGWKEVPVEIVDWPEDKQAEFVIKDNVSGGEWDWDALANEWDAEKINAWGVDIPQWSTGHDVNSMSDEDLDMTEEFDAIGSSAGLQRVVFIFDGPDEAISWLNKDPSLPVKKFNNAWQVNLSTQSTL